MTVNCHRFVQACEISNGEGLICGSFFSGRDGSFHIKISLSEQEKKKQEEPEEDEGNVLRFYMTGNSGDFSTSAVIRRFADPTCAVSNVKLTEAMRMATVLGGAKYKVVMIGLCLNEYHIDS